MDILKYYDITHGQHLICNPFSEKTLDELINLMDLESNSKILEIASGKAEFVIRIIEKYRCQGTAVDISPYHIRDARKKIISRIPDSDLKIIELDGAKFKPDKPNGFDLSACLGASWIYTGYQQTLQFLDDNTKKGGLIVIGEPYWKKDPEKEFLRAISQRKEAFGTHFKNVAIGEKMGLKLIYSFVSSEDDWDKYEGLQWYGVDKYCRSNPEDPDNKHLSRSIQKRKLAYLKYGRNCMGWAIYLFRKRD